MKKARWFISFLTLVGVAAAAEAYHVVNKISVPGDGGWDYLTVDAPARRLFISHGTQVVVLDVDTLRVIGQIADTPGVHGIALSPDRGFTSNGKEGAVTIFDRQSLRVLGKVQAGQNPDAIIYDPASQRVFTFNGRSKDSTAIEAATGQAAGTIPLGGKPEFAVADGSGTVFVNIEDRSELVSIDSKSLTLRNRWPLAPCEEPSSLAMDIAHRRLFAGCGNKKMAVIDADTGKVITTLPIGEHVDATVFDPETRRAFNSNGEGTITVIQEDTPNDFHVVENVPTQKGARTIALDTKTHRLFLTDADFGPTPAATPEQPHPRPAILPGTFVVLVVTQN
jgi:DNA-binding beta-propeller fold protein YncE